MPSLFAHKCDFFELTLLKLVSVIHNVLNTLTQIQPSKDSFNPSLSLVLMFLGIQQWRVKIMDTSCPWVPFPKVNFITWHKPLAIEMDVLCKEVYLKTSLHILVTRYKLNSFTTINIIIYNVIVNSISFSSNFILNKINYLFHQCGS
jgi:hypothetical protein